MLHEWLDVFLSTLSLSHMRMLAGCVSPKDGLAARLVRMGKGDGEGCGLGRGVRVGNRFSFFVSD